MSNRIRGTNWVGTTNNPTVAVCEALCGLVEAGHCRYVRFQMEMAPSTGTVHYQWYIQTTRRVALVTLKDWIGDRGSHIEKRRGDHAQADDYCDKEDSRFHGVLNRGMVRSGVFGEPNVRQGQRNDLESLKRSIDSGSTEVELFDEHFGTMLRYYKGVSHYKRAKLDRRRVQTEAVVLFGLTGVGKSYRANHMYPDAFHLRRPNNGPLWWDGYVGQETVIVDEFEGWMSLNFFKLLIDENPLQIAIKGAHVEFCARRVIFVSNKDPREWWPKACPGGRLPGPVVRRMTAPVGGVYRVLRQQAAGDEDLYEGAESVDVSVALPVFHVSGDNN